MPENDRNPLISKSISEKETSSNKETPDPEEIFSSDQLLFSVGESAFLLVRMAMLRALEISDGSPPLVKYHASEKTTTIALREIAQGKITSSQKPAASTI